MKAAHLPTGSTVRFATDLCSYHEGAVLDIDSVNEAEVWYQVEELQCIKRQALKMTNDINSPNLGRLLSNIYGKCNNDTIEAITAWSISCESLRGLERFTNKDFRDKRSVARRRTIQVVLTAQHKMRNEGVKDNDYIESVLGRLSETLSHNYSRFAALMGRADTLAVKQCDNIDCSDNLDASYSQKIVPNQMIIRDATIKKSSDKERLKLRGEKSSSYRSPFRSGTKRILGVSRNTQVDCMEMRYCF